MKSTTNSCPSFSMYTQHISSEETRVGITGHDTPRQNTLLCYCPASERRNCSSNASRLPWLLLLLGDSTSSSVVAVIMDEEMFVVGEKYTELYDPQPHRFFLKREIYLFMWGSTQQTPKSRAALYRLFIYSYKCFIFCCICCAALQSVPCILTETCCGLYTEV